MNSKLNIRRFILSISVLTVFTTISIWAINTILFSKGFNRDLPIWVNYLLAFLLTIFPMQLPMELSTVIKISIDEENIEVKRLLRQPIVIKRRDIKRQVIKTARTSRSPSSYIYSTNGNKNFFVNKRLFKNFGSLINALNKDKEIVHKTFAPISIYYLIAWAALIVTLGTVFSRLGSS